MASFDDRNRIEEIVKKYAELLKCEMNIRDVYLYGSYVKGNYTEDSDIDIAVVGDDFSDDIIENTLKLMKLRRKIDNRIEPHPFNSKDFNISNPFVKDIIETGIKIM
ncbi:MAG: nucleotidyltransferase domain-containing protein [Caloramator sp.]|nr:nucleotidyltransferase domain-containing protein [Caloramator sp.]